jgi:hypothetical protein
MQKKSSKNTPAKRTTLAPEVRARRMQQLLLGVVAVVMILSMIIALVAH